MINVKFWSGGAYESQNSDHQNLQEKQSKNKCGQIVTNVKKMYGTRAGRVAPCQKSNSPNIKCRLS